MQKENISNIANHFLLFKSAVAVMYFSAIKYTLK